MAQNRGEDVDANIMRADVAGDEWSMSQPHGRGWLVYDSATGGWFTTLQPCQQDGTVFSLWINRWFSVFEVKHLHILIIKLLEGDVLSFRNKGFFGDYTINMLKITAFFNHFFLLWWWKSSRSPTEQSARNGCYSLLQNLLCLIFVFQTKQFAQFGNENLKFITSLGDNISPHRILRGTFLDQPHDIQNSLPLFQQVSSSFLLTSYSDVPHA